MRVQASFSSSGRCRVAVALAVIAVGGLAPTARAAQDPERSIPVMIQTVPELPGARFSLSGTPFQADENGLALTVVSQPGRYRLRVLSTKLSREQGQLQFSMWSDQTNDTGRFVDVQSFTYLQAGFEISRPLSFEFIGNDGTPVEPEQVDSIFVTDASGERARLTGTGPHRLVTSSPSPDGKNLTLRDRHLEIQDVIIDGRDVLNPDVSVGPTDTSDELLQLAVSTGGDSAAVPEAEDPGPTDVVPELPSWFWIALVAAASAVLLVLVGRQLHVISAAKGVVARVRTWSPGTHMRRLNPGPHIAAAWQSIKRGGHTWARGLRRLNPVPPMTAGLRRMNPKPALDTLKKFNPKPRIASGIEELKSKTSQRPKAAKAPTPEARPQRPKAKEARAPRESRARKASAPKLRQPRPAKVKAPRAKRMKQPGQPRLKGSLRRVQSFSPGRRLTAAIRRRRLRSQLNALKRAGSGPKVKQARGAAPAAAKKPRGITLLWLRSSQSRGSMRSYARGPKVRIKLRNGHLVIGTIRRTPSHVDQDALNIFVERVYDQFGNEMVNSPEDSFILPSQIVRIERFTEEENTVIRLPEPEENRVIRLPDTEEDRVIRLPEPEDRVAGHSRDSSEK
jgi:hypothetical protein